MKRVSRRAFVGASVAAAGVVATAGILPRRASAAEFSYKFANNVPVTHPTNIVANKMVQRIKEESKGRLEIQIFPNNQLGGDTDMLSQLRSGAIEFFTLSGLILATLVPAASINGIGFAWKDYDAVWPAMDGELGAYLRAQIAKAGLVAMDKMWDNGYREITSSTKPINTAADLKGFKIRVPVSPLWTSMFEAFGASPASINFNEVYSALQTKVVEGQENPLSIIEIGKLYEVQKYCSLTNHMWDGFWFLANGQAWNALPKDLQEIAARNFNAAALEQRQQIRQLNDSLQGKLQASGMVFNKPDPQSFRAALQKAKFYENWKAKYGNEAWALLEKYTGKLA
ncbi:MAG TPA: TRAP transporter substrate-binding protein [Stellaceae bacterium]|nr:TRAP transporter substrate-binding protein [Stellaceae bacterium]